MYMNSIEMIKEMKRIKEFMKEFEKYNDLGHWTINDNMEVDVDGDINLCGYFFYKRSEDQIKLPIQFGKVTGMFSISQNRLISLKGCPETVGGNFYCYDNCLTSLEYSPKYVGGNYVHGKSDIKFSRENVEKVCKVVGKSG